MSLEIKLSQKLSQSLVMTPQLQQAIKLLQLGRQEYLEVIEKELLENPVLEDSREESEEGGEKNSEESYQELVSLADKHVKEEWEAAQNPSENAASSEATVDASWLEQLDASPYPSRSKGGGEERPSLEATVSNPEGLSSHILWQLRTSDIAERDKEIAVQIVGNVDRNGYLRATLEELAEVCSSTVRDVQNVLSLVQTLDPVGIAARDLGECLQIQLEQRGFGGGLAARIVDGHLDKLANRRYDLIAREEKVAVEEVYEAVKQIQKLEPRPGRPFVDEAPVYITPDIYVKKIGNEYVISLNDADMPRLRLSQRYRELFEKGAAGNLPDKDYLQGQIKSAAWLIKSIHQRQQTIYKVTESIVKFQGDFLESGVSHLKPLVLRDVADDVGMHESTVSRVTNNKYVHTPQGVYELKFFFTSGLSSDSGAVSSESVKERIKDIISKEDSRKPLSDQAIVGMLKAEGVEIARRTVAKYREAMNIQPSSRRKKLF